MKSPSDVLCAGVIKVANALESGKYDVAARASTDLIRLAYQLESSKEVFIGEVVEAACIQTGRIQHLLVIPEQDLDLLTDKLRTHVAELVDAYKNQQSVCTVLQTIRYEITAFQIDAEFKYPQRSKVDSVRR